MTEGQSKRETRAAAELKQLQDIIARYESQAFQIRAWLLVLVGALVAGILKNLPPMLFLALSGVVVPVFAFMELVTRRPKRRAIERVGEIEEVLRSEGIYDGPSIQRTLSSSAHSKWRFIRSEIRVANFWAFYVALLLVSAIVALTIQRFVGWYGRFEP